MDNFFFEDVQLLNHKVFFIYNGEKRYEVDVQ